MSGRLTFDLAAVAAELEAVKAAPVHLPLYGERTGPGLWLVGDQGVYLMGNHAREAPPEGKSHPVVYAKECDPRGDFDSWWNMKRATFGGDDGVEFISVAQAEEWLREAERISIKFDAVSYALETIRRKETVQ